jgi:hypothetical protein
VIFVKNPETGRFLFFPPIFWRIWFLCISSRKLATTPNFFFSNARVCQVTPRLKANFARRTDLVERRRPGGGRHRISILDEDVALTEVVRNDPFATAVQARNLMGFSGCLKTAQRHIKSSGLRNHVAANKPGLTQQHKEARISLVLEYLKDEAFGSRVVFSHEKMFQSSRNGRIRVYRPRNSRFSERYIHNTHNSGRFSVNIWSWISVRSPGVMLHVEERLNNDVYIRILENIMVASVAIAYPNNDYIFQ